MRRAKEPEGNGRLCYARRGPDVVTVDSILVGRVCTTDRFALMMGRAVVVT